MRPVRAGWRLGTETSVAQMLENDEAVVSPTGRPQHPHPLTLPLPQSFLVNVSNIL